MSDEIPLRKWSEPDDDALDATFGELRSARSAQADAQTTLWATQEILTDLIAELRDHMGDTQWPMNGGEFFDFTTQGFQLADRAEARLREVSGDE